MKKIPRIVLHAMISSSCLILINCSNTKSCNLCKKHIIIKPNDVELVKVGDCFHGGIFPNRECFYVKNIDVDSILVKETISNKTSKIFLTEFCFVGYYVNKIDLSEQTAEVGYNVSFQY